MLSNTVEKETKIAQKLKHVSGDAQDMHESQSKKVKKNYGNNKDKEFL